MIKKILLGMTTLSCIALASQDTNLYLKTGADIWQKFDVITPRDSETINRKKADRMGYELTFEATREIYPNLEFGAGISYQDHGSTKSLVDREYDVKLDMPKFSSVPIYLVTKYNIPTNSNIKPYLKADLGYSFNHSSGSFKVTEYDPEETRKFSSDIKNGLYFGVGAGVEYNNFVADLMYKVNKAKFEAISSQGEKAKEDFDYSRVTLSVGYKFNF